MSDGLALPTQEQINKYTLDDALDARDEWATKALSILNDENATPEQLDDVAQIQKATGQIGERIDALKVAFDAKADFEQMRRDIEAGTDAVLHKTESPQVRKRIGNMADAMLSDSGFAKALNTWKEHDGSVGASGVIDVDTDVFFKGTQMGAEYKATLGTDDTLTNVDTEYTPRQERLPGVVEVLYDVNNISSLFPNMNISVEVIRYMVETVAAQGAATTEEGALINEASIAFAEATADIFKLAVSMPATLEGLALESFLRGHLTMRLRDFLLNKEDLDLLKGAGTTEIAGITVVAGTQSENVSLGGSPTGQDWAEAIFRAATKIRQVFLIPDRVTMSADGWQTLRLAREATTNGYLNAAITEAGVARVFGLPVMLNENVDNVTGAVNTDQPFVVTSRQAAGIHRRQGISVSFTDSHADRFLRDIVTFKATERLGIAYYRPAGIAIVTAVT